MWCQEKTGVDEDRAAELNDTEIRDGVNDSCEGEGRNKLDWTDSGAC